MSACPRCAGGKLSRNEDGDLSCINCGHIEYQGGTISQEEAEFEERRITGGLQRNRKAQPPGSRRAHRAAEICTEPSEECWHEAVIQGLCRKHYDRKRRVARTYVPKLGPAPGRQRVDRPRPAAGAER